MDNTCEIPSALIILWPTRDTLKKNNANYHNTVTYLIGIHLKRTVTHNTSTLQNIVLYFTILCLEIQSRGFDISESVGLYYSTLKILAFTRGKSQLSGIEVEQTRKIATSVSMLKE